jgi:hypothetical protein
MTKASSSKHLISSLLTSFQTIPLTTLPHHLCEGDLMANVNRYLSLHCPHFPVYTKSKRVTTQKRENRKKKYYLAKDLHKTSTLGQIWGHLASAVRLILRYVQKSDRRVGYAPQLKRRLFCPQKGRVISTVAEGATEISIQEKISPLHSDVVGIPVEMTFKTIHFAHCVRSVAATRRFRMSSLCWS